MKTLAAILMTLALSFPAYADDVDVLMVKATQSDGRWLFSVTVHHPDDDSAHMMDQIAIFTPDGNQIAAAMVPSPSVGARHVTVQVSDVIIPEDVEYIVIRGHCSDDGWTHEGITISLM